MADIIDSASEIEELQRNTAIMRRLNHQAVSATHCCECGDPIDELRRLAFRVVGLVQVARKIWSLSVNREVRSERNSLSGTA